MSADMNDTAFDHAWQLPELLDAEDMASLGTALSALLEAPLTIEDARGHLLWGGAQGAATRRVALVLEFDPVGQLVSPAPAEKLAHAAYLANSLLLSRLSLRMATCLHQESVAEDYAELRRAHARLLDSEARYRNLAGQLETRVQEQLAELEARQQRLYQAARLATVGQLAAGVAHEINNPLGFVRSNLGTLGTYLGRLANAAQSQEGASTASKKADINFLTEDAHAIISESQEGLDRIARIVHELKDFSTIDIETQSTCDLNTCLRQCAALLDGEAPAGIAMQLDLGALPPVPGVAGHLNQAFLSLMRNAVQAIQEAGHPGTVHITSRTSEAMAEISISDDGIGMSEELQQKAFDPFFTTRPVGCGAGLGLSSARSIVLAHGGQISLLSQRGAGTTVTIRLPLP